MRGLLALLFVPVLLLGCHNNGTPHLCEATLQSVLESTLTELGVPGAAALVVNAAGEQWRGAAGYSKLSIPGLPHAWTGVPMRTDLHTRAGSITKSFTAALILRLWEEGLLDLEDVIDAYYPGLVPHSDTITIRQLLNMTAGLIDYTRVPDWAEAWPADAYTPGSLVQAAVDAGGISFPPGEGWEYSNTNYVVLGMIAEHVGGASYASLVRQYLIAPLGLNQTHVREPGDAHIPEPVLHGYTWAFSEELVWQDYTGLAPDWAFSAGNIVSTLDDLYVWMHVLVEGTFLSAGAHALMWDMVDTGGALFYGMGVLHISESGLDIRGHNGGMPAYETSAYRYNDVYIVVMTNGNVHPDNELQSHAGDYIGKALAAAVYGQDINSDK